jgi:hypothetical protein
MTQKYLSAPRVLAKIVGEPGVAECVSGVMPRIKNVNVDTMMSIS